MDDVRFGIEALHIRDAAAVDTRTAERRVYSRGGSPKPYTRGDVGQIAVRGSELGRCRRGEARGERRRGDRVVNLRVIRVFGVDEGMKRARPGGARGRDGSASTASSGFAAVHHEFERVGVRRSRRARRGERRRTGRDRSGDGDGRAGVSNLEASGGWRRGSSRAPKPPPPRPPRLARAVPFEGPGVVDTTGVADANLAASSSAADARISNVRSDDSRSRRRAGVLGPAMDVGEGSRPWRESARGPATTRRRRGFDRDAANPPTPANSVHDSVLVHLFGGFRAERSGANRGTESATETCDVDAARADGCLRRRQARASTAAASARVVAIPTPPTPAPSRRRRRRGVAV